MRGVISTEAVDPETLVQKAREIRKMVGTDLARVVSTKSIYTFDAADSRNQAGDPLLAPGFIQKEEAGRRLLHVVAYDFGIKLNILRMLAREGCRVTVVPAETTAEDKNNLTGKVEITAHNHNFAVDPDSINLSEVELTHVDLNDNTLEGLRHRTLPLFSVQYHPEAAPGPHDSHYLFHDFRKMMEEWKG